MERVKPLLFTCKLSILFVSTICFFYLSAPIGGDEAIGIKIRNLYYRQTFAYYYSPSAPGQPCGATPPAALAEFQRSLAT